MTLYRASPADGVAWVTGASSGIGRQLALDLAREGYTVAASARGADKLAELSQAASGLKGRVVAFPCDVTDEAANRTTVEAIERDVGPIVLAVFNAGNYFPTKVERFAAENVIKTFEINVFGAVYGLAPVLEVMRSRGRGQVGLVGSVSGYFGLPAAAAYGASKAAINNFAWSLKYDLDRMNIRIQVFNPGFIDTPLTEKNDFTMPALMPVEKAAQRMADGIRTGGTEITFPRRFTYVLKALTLLPNSWTYAIYRRFTGWSKKPTIRP